MSFNPFLILWTARRCCLCSGLLSQLSGNLVSTVASDCQLSVCTGVVPVPYKHLGIGIFFLPSLKSGWALYAVKFFCAVQISWGRFLWWTFPDSSLCCCGTSASFSSWRCVVHCLLLSCYSFLPSSLDFCKTLDLKLLKPSLFYFLPSNLTWCWWDPETLTSSFLCPFCDMVGSVFLDFQICREPWLSLSPGTNTPVDFLSS